MLRLILCDLDGTLLRRGEKSIKKETLSVIKRLCDKGILFSVASGRPYNQLKPLFGELAPRIIFICLDGAAVFKNDCVIYKNRLCKKEAARLLSLDCKKEIFGRDRSVILDGAADTQSINLLGGEVYKLAFYGTNPPQSPAYRLCYERDGIFEIVSPTADKADAARAVAEKFSVQRENILAIGDGANDENMLLFAGKAYRTENCDAVLSDRGFAVTPDVTETLREQI